MADSVNKANKRQASNNRRKTEYMSNFEQGKRNKIRKLRKRLADHPNDMVAAKALTFWNQNGHKVQGTKRK